jgi:hypothetical protein
MKMKLYLTLAMVALIGISTSIAQPQNQMSALTQTQTFKCYERVGKFAHGSNVAVVVTMNDQEVNVTSLKGEAASTSYSSQDATVVNTRTGEWLKLGDFTIESSGSDRRAYYNYNSKKPLEHLTLKCFAVK